MATDSRAANQDHIDNYRTQGPARMGIMTSHVWREDPRRVLFVLARYKFVAKMLSGFQNVLEVGCGDGFGSRIVLQEVGSVHGVDVEPAFIDNCSKENPSERATFSLADLTRQAVTPRRDAAYALDVLEHIPPALEHAFMSNLCASLDEGGVCLLGMPSLESQQYASEWSKMEHVNCKKGADFKQFMRRYFRTVFLFSMNDEVVHTGYSPMAQYLLCLGVGVAG